MIMTSSKQYVDDDTEYVFVRNDDDYFRYSSSIFYEFIDGGLIRVLLFERQRMYDTKVEYTLQIPDLEEDERCNWIIRLYKSKDCFRSDIPKSETCRIMEEYFLDSVHLPIGCTDETTSQGKYWMFNDEVDITDPCPPLLDRIGVQDWTLIGGRPRFEERFTGNLREAMERYNQARMFETQSMVSNDICRALFGGGEIDDGSRSRIPYYLIADSFPDFVFTFKNGRLEVNEDGKLVLRMPVSKMDRFIQKSINLS